MRQQASPGSSPNGSPAQGQGSPSSSPSATQPGSSSPSASSTPGTGGAKASSGGQGKGQQGGAQGGSKSSQGGSGSSPGKSAGSTRSESAGGSASEPGAAGTPSGEKSPNQTGQSAEGQPSDKPGEQQGQGQGQGGSAGGSAGKPSGSREGAPPKGSGGSPAGGQPQKGSDESQGQPGGQGGAGPQSSGASGGAGRSGHGGRGDKSGSPGGATAPDSSVATPPAASRQQNLDETVAPKGLPPGELSLRKIRDLIDKDQVPPDLLKDMNMSKEELNQFVKKFEKPPAGPSGPGREVDVKLKPGEKLDPNAKLPELKTTYSVSSQTGRDRGTAVRDTARNNVEALRSPPPVELRSGFDAYRNSLSRSRTLKPIRRPVSEGGNGSGGK